MLTLLLAAACVLLVLLSAGVLLQRGPVGNLPLQLLASPLVPMWVSAVCAPFFFGEPFRLRAVNGPVSKGLRRWKLCLAQLLACLLFAAVMIYGTIAACLLLRGRIPLRTVLQLAWRCFPLHFAALCGTLAIPMLLSLVIPNTGVSIVVTFTLTYLIQKLMEYAASSEWIDRLLQWYPAYQLANPALWSAPTAELITRLLLCSVLPLALCLLVGIGVVSKRDLP